MLWQNFRISVRSLLRVPEFALTSVLTVAVAVGMATSVFSVVNAVLFRPLPYQDARRLAVIWSSSPSEARGPVSFDDFEDWRRASKTLESAALYTSYYKPILSGSGYAERLSALLVSHQYFAVMGAKPKLGRFFTAEEDRDGRDDVVVLSYELWRGKFHADPSVVGRSILLNSRPHTIVGVAGPDLAPLPPSMAEETAQIYRPVGEPFGPGSRDGRHLNTLVRLRPGVSIDQAQAELNVRSRQMEREHPDVDAHLAARISSLRDDMTRNVRAPLVALQAAVLMLLLIACANVANLLLAKSSARRREMAIREALGAGTAQLVQMLLTESLVLGLLGGLGGLVLAVWSTAGMTAIAARVLPDAGAISIDPRVLVFSLLLSLASSLLFGIAPVFWLSSEAPGNALKDGSRIAGDHRKGLRQSLAAVQIALALVLLVATGLLGKSLLRLRSVNPGFDPNGVMTATVSLPQARYRNDAAVVQFFDRVLANLRAAPGVSEAAMVSVVPMSGDFDRTGFVIRGKQFGADEQNSPDRYIVSPGYFRALHIPLRRGRVFNASDDSNHPPVCLISETAARLWFAGQSPLGQKIRAGSASGDFDTSPFREVVGVVGDIAQYGLGLPPTPQIYMPQAQFATVSLTLLVRTNAGADTVAGSMRKVVFGVDAEQPVYNVKPLEEIVSNTIAARRLGVWLLAIFALSALSLAVIGIYGVVSYSVARRTSEFGIRMALGARPADVARQAVGDSLGMVAAGLAAGVVASFVTARLIAGFLFGVSTTDAAAFAILPLFLAVVAVAACYLPARRAARVDPVTALRFE
jgi:putative ABC transport system permease protein